MTAVCRIPLSISIFFDGTGNNREADEPTFRDSNVARLYRAHHADDPAEGIYRIYVPGIGTYFRDIGDPGQKTTGQAFGAFGEERLKWAMRQVDLILAKYPAKRIEGVSVALFGFSRGAALARAFALRLAARVKGQQGRWILDRPGVPLRIAFMGLFDTVAAVGPPATAHTAMSAAIAAGGMSLKFGIGQRGGHLQDGPLGLAFGDPGADPTPGVADGHSAWASDLHVPRLVEHCLHLVAAHEQRNSFPCDSIRTGHTYSQGCVEIVYPGMHSDVGGGYLPGFQGRSLNREEALSNIPLRMMHRAAMQHFVPLRPIGAFLERKLEVDFQVSPLLLKRWKHYMRLAGNTSRPLGHAVLAHMRIFFAWRFQRIGARLASNPALGATEADIRAGEGKHRQQKAVAKREMDAHKNSPEVQAAQQAMRQADREYASAVNGAVRFGDSSGRLAAASKAREQAQQRLQAAQDPFLRAQARWAGIPEGSLDNLLVYDAQLMRDAQILRESIRTTNSNKRVRPHYAALLQAYEDEFVNNRGLRDPEVIAFFDDYVHDSLAGFAMDVSLPSDPRAIYIGGDKEAKYANVDDPDEQRVAAVGDQEADGEDSIAA